MKRAAKAILIGPDGLALLLRRSNTHPHIPLTLDIPGGTFDDAENGIDALIREVKEEVGVDIADKTITLFKKVAFEAYERVIELELYEVTGFETHPDVVLSFGHDKYEWVKVEKLNDEGYFKEIIQEYITSKNG